MKKLISIVAPMYNEELLVSTYCAEMLKMIEPLSEKYDFEIIMVNDGSRDNTYALMLQEQINTPEVFTTVCLTRNFGLEGAVDAGIRVAKGDAVVVMDADLQDPPTLIPEMISKWENGADVVVGSRIARSHDGLFKKAGANFYYHVLNMFSGKLKLEKSAANFRLLSRKALDQVLALPEVNGVFRVVVPFVGMKTDIVEYDRDKRYAGKTKYNLKSMIPYALDSITGLSVEPLHKVIFLVPIILVLALICFVLVFVAPADLKQLMVVLLFCCLGLAANFGVLAIIAEYLAQVMTEVKGRPTSIIYHYKPSMSAIERKEEEK